MSPEEVIRELLVGVPMSTKRADALASEIVEALEEAGHLLDGECTTVAVGNYPLVPVETVEAYGLTIRLDAMGEASEVSARDGLVIVG